MENLEKARELLKKIHPQNEADFAPVLVNDHPDFTILISANDFGEAEPLIEIIRNKDLLRLYDYSIRCLEGDPAFDNFNGHFMDLGNDDLTNIFADMFYALVKIDRNNVCRVMNLETFMRKVNFKLTVL